MRGARCRFITCVWRVRRLDQQDVNFLALDGPVLDPF